MAVNPTLRFAVVETRNVSELIETTRRDVRIRYLEPERAMQAFSFTPNDPVYPAQYGPQQVQAPGAWAQSLGSDLVNICTVDSGLRYNHVEFAGRWVGGHDFVHNDADPWDDLGHGTHVAGIIAAGINDGTGIAGLANVGVLAAKVLNEANSANDATIANGIQWCADHDGDVINLSLGSASYSQAIADAVAYAWNKGSLLVAATGNSGPCNDCIAYPAKLPQVIAVTCTNMSEAFCVLTSGRTANTGPESALAAPGLHVLSSCFEHRQAYCLKSGTSMSAPHVTGVAALVWSQRPSLANCQLRSILEATAKDLGPGGRDPQFGFGLVNASGAMDAVLAGNIPPLTCNSRNAPLCRVLSPAVTQTLRGQASFRVHSASATSTVDAVRLYVDGVLATPLQASGNGIYEGAIDTSSWTDGAHQVEVRCTDLLGLTGSSLRDHLFDQTPSPSVQIVDPEENGGVAGVQLIKVHAVSNVGDSVIVKVRINGGSWTDITANRLGDDYVHLWDATLAPRQSSIEASASDLGGTSFDASGVRVVDSLKRVHDFGLCVAGVQIPHGLINPCCLRPEPDEESSRKICTEPQEPQ